MSTARLNSGNVGPLSHSRRPMRMIPEHMTEPLSITMKFMSNAKSNNGVVGPVSQSLEATSKEVIELLSSVVNKHQVMLNELRL
jgi:hypothetical protein